MDGFVQRVTTTDDAGAGAGKPAAVPDAESALVTARTDRVGRLITTLEADVIPRLALTRGRPPCGVAAGTVDANIPTAEDVVEFTKVVLANDVAVACVYVEQMQARGTSLETVYLGLLAPTARYLGHLWDTDQCDFTQVTVGLALLQQVLRARPAAFRSEQHHWHSLRVLLIPASSEQHTFGLSMVAEFFLREGWDVTSGAQTSHGNLLEMVAEQRFDIVGLSAGCGSQLDALALNIRAIRKASRNRALGVMVGGNVFQRRPELVTLVGADATAVDASHAPRQAGKLLDLLAHTYHG
jgi:methanogenic corrinoid protein MtbC1